MRRVRCLGKTNNVCCHIRRFLTATAAAHDNNAVLQVCKYSPKFHAIRGLWNRCIHPAMKTIHFRLPFGSISFHGPTSESGNQFVYPMEKSLRPCKGKGCDGSHISQLSRKTLHMTEYAEFVLDGPNIQTALCGLPGRRSLSFNIRRVA